MPELKPCPFCGGKATIQRAHPWFMLKKYRDKFAFAGCAKCGISTRMIKVPATGSPLMNEHETEVMNYKLAEIWNTRRPDCEHAEHDGIGCLGYAECSQDDEPIDACKNCREYTGNKCGEVSEDA